MGDWWLGEISGMSCEGERERVCCERCVCVANGVAQFFQSNPKILTKSCQNLDSPGLLIKLKASVLLSSAMQEASSSLQLHVAASIVSY